MKKIILSLLSLCLSNFAFAQTSQTLSAGVPLWFTSTGTGTYNQTALYHSYTYGYKLELARTSDLLTANPIDFRITARGNGYHPFFIQGATGNVGIGTTSPSSKLHVFHEPIIGTVYGTNKGLGVSSSDGGGSIYGSDMNHSIFFRKGRDGTHDVMDFYEFGDIRFFTSGNIENQTQKMVIKKSGNVGIGTNAPDHKLHVEGSLLLDVFGNNGHEKGIFFREGFSNTNKYNVSILAYDHNAGGASPDGLSINGVDGVSFSTGSDTRNERMRVAQNGNVGIGTTTPTEKLEVNGNIKGPGAESYITGFKGILGRPSDGILHLRAGKSSGPVFINYYETGIVSIAKGGGNVGIGTASPTEKLSVDGNILAKKVRVSIAAADWPDYVFAPNYELKTLSEVENYIKANQHLPEVPSAKEVAANGLDLGSMDATLLKKVEELTLYLIEQDKKQKTLDTRQETLENDNSNLKKENQELKDRLTKIEALLKTLTSK